MTSYDDISDESIVELMLGKDVVALGNRARAGDAKAADLLQTMLESLEEIAVPWMRLALALVTEEPEEELEGERSNVYEDR